jgi:hypothetical protein
MLICVCLRILASSRIPRYDLGRQNPSFLRWFCHRRGGLARPHHGGGPTLTASQNLTTRAVRDKLKVETTGDGCDAGSSHSVGVEHTCGEDE